MLLVSTSCNTSARNRDTKLGDDGFGANKQAGIKREEIDLHYVQE